eukprot:COSAG02_NODE_40831_length_401_cov_0.685430_1_plen_39_part_10
MYSCVECDSLLYITLHTSLSSPLSSSMPSLTRDNSGVDL